MASQNQQNRRNAHAEPYGVDSPLPSAGATRYAVGKPPACGGKQSHRQEWSGRPGSSLHHLQATNFHSIEIKPVVVNIESVTLAAIGKNQAPHRRARED